MMAEGQLNSERQRLDEYVATLILQIQESEAKLLRVNQENETYHSEMRAIRHEKEDTINQRKKVDEHLQSLNNEITDKREVLVRLQGNLQYRKEEKINEAIRRLEYQLVANNYKVTEEIKIVHEIDRLKRSKKSLCQYLALKEELDRTKDKLNTMRNERDALYRRVASFKSGEEKTKNNVRENRVISDSLKKEIDELHTQKRKAIADLKLASQHLLHLKELHQQPCHRRTHSFTKKGQSNDDFSGSNSTVSTPSNIVQRFTAPAPATTSSQDVSSNFQKRFLSRRSPITPPDPRAEQIRLCSTLATYLLRMTNLTVTPSATPAVTPVIEPRAINSEEYVDGEWITVLHKRSQPEDQRCSRTLRKNKKEKKGHSNKSLSHTPEVLLQFSALGMKPPTIVGDIQICLEKLEAKKDNLLTERLRTTSNSYDVAQSQVKTEVASCNDLIDSTTPIVEINLSIESANSMENLTNHLTQESTICNNAPSTNNNLGEYDNDLSKSCRIASPTSPSSSSSSLPPDIVVSRCDDESKLPPLDSENWNNCKRRHPVT